MFTKVLLLKGFKRMKDKLTLYIKLTANILLITLILFLSLQRHLNFGGLLLFDL